MSLGDLFALLLPLRPVLAFVCIKGCLVALCVLVLESMSFAQELLQNPGFEADSPDHSPGWTINTWGQAAPQFRVSRAGTDAREGRFSQRVEVTELPAGAGVILRQEFLFRQGHVYRARLWLRSPDKAQVQVLMRRAGPHYEAGALRGIEVGRQWQEVRIEGGFGDGDVPGFLGLSFRRPGTVMVDGASLVDITTEVLGRPTPSEPIPASFLGIHINKLGSHNVWPDLGAGLLRLWDSGTRWCDVQPEPDRWEWQRLDYYVRHAQGHAPGASILLTLGGTPKWAGPPGGAGSESGPGTSAPARMEDWRRYVRTVGQRYKGVIRYWEIWNESDFSGFYTGTPAQMVQMAGIARLELKAIDSVNVLLSPNITRAGLPWLNDYFSLGGGQHADLISYHRYQPVSPENAIPEYAAVQDLVRSHGLGDKPIWNTEGAVECETPLSEEAAMGAVARAYLVQWAQGIRNFSWYCWDIHWPGGANLSKNLIGAELAAGGEAYRRVANWLIGAKMSRRTVEGNTWTVELQLADGRQSLVVWNSQGETRLRLPSIWRTATRQDLRGKLTEVVGSETSIGRSPVLLQPNP
jgi:hypothetical protein